MSGWISGKFGYFFWKKLYPKLPKGVADAVQKGGRTFDEIEGIPPAKQHPTMPQEQVNQEFRKKENRVRQHHRNVSKGK